MKKISKLVLSQIARKELSQRQQRTIKGGRHCTCGCCYAGSGGSNTDWNGCTNNAGGDNGLHTGCPDEVWYLIPC